MLSFDDDNDKIVVSAWTRHGPTAVIKLFIFHSHFDERNEIPLVDFYKYILCSDKFQAKGFPAQGLHKE